MTESAKARRLLVFMPHPDDEAYSAGGLMALAAAAGWDVRLVCASFGERGKRHDGGPAGREALAAARAAELAASCRELGAKPPVIWGLPDGGLRGVEDGPARVRGAIDAVSPDLVVTLGPDGAYGHPDHLAVHAWVRDGSRLEGRPCPVLWCAFPAGLFVPQWEKVRGMLGDTPAPAQDELGVSQPGYVVPIGVFAGTKQRAIAAHQTQLPGGDPEALFPPGIVAALLSEEWYEAADSAESAASLLAEITGAATGSG
ncbi:MAG: PIG-L deacetylase family protein [Dehalococcoidia bacterium]